MNKKIIYFGAAGAASAYCQHTKILPDFFVDNDPNKWGKFIDGVEIKNPIFLKSIMIEKIVITSGYVKDILPQILNMGIDRDKIHSPAKCLLGFHIFDNEANRFQAANKLHQIMTNLDHKWKIVSVGGTALGFARDGDFIYWDSDIDLFAPEQSKSAVFDLLQGLGYNPEHEANSIKAAIVLDNGVEIPFSVVFFNTDSDTFIDRFEDYCWEWPTIMFTQCVKIEVHGKLLNVPSSINKYLSKVYGESWSVPNPEFGYSDYAGKIS
jgi:hypothetical protein